MRIASTATSLNVRNPCFGIAADVMFLVSMFGGEKYEIRLAMRPSWRGNRGAEAYSTSMLLNYIHTCFIVVVRGGGGVVPFLENMLGIFERKR